MAKIAGVYKITNIYNGKSYIGISNDIERRWKDHIRGSTLNEGKNSLIQRAIRKNGADSFHFEILEELENLEDRLEAEVMFIKRYDTFENGYNLTEGGENPPHFKGEDNPTYRSDLNGKELYEAFLESGSYINVGKNFNTSDVTARERIKEYCLDNDIEVPKIPNATRRYDIDTKSLYDSFLELNSYEKVAKKFNCNHNMVSSRIKKYCFENNLEIPKLICSSRREDLNSKDLYDSYLELGSYEKVAKKFNCGANTVRRRILKYCSNNDIELEAPTKVGKLYDFDSEEMYLSYLEEGSYAAVARKFNCSFSTARYRINKYCSDNDIELEPLTKFGKMYDFDNEELYLAYLELGTYEAVARMYDCTSQTIRERIDRYCSDNGIELSKKAYRRRREDLKDKELYESYLELRSYKQVAKKFNCGNQIVARRIKEYCFENNLEVPKSLDLTKRADLNSENLYKSYLELESYSAVARKFNCSDSTVKRRIKKYKEENGL